MKEVQTQTQMRQCVCGAQWDPSVQAHRYCSARKRKCSSCGGLGYTGRRSLNQPLLVTCQKCKGSGDAS